MRFVLCIFLSLLSLMVQAHHIKGLVVDKAGSPVVAAAVILQKVDSTFVSATVTNEKGEFGFDKDTIPYCIIIQHISYKTQRISSSNASLGTVVLEERTEVLNEVTVSAKSSVLRVKENGALLYDIKELTKTSPVSNVLDILQEIPSVQRVGDNYEIVGTAGTTIILNGRKTNMTPDQLKELLSTTSPSQVKAVEIFYNTPSQYGVKGAAINIVMNRLRTDNLQFKGGLRTALYQGFYYYQTGGVDFTLSNKRWSWDIGYALGSTNRHYDLTLNSDHTVEDQTYDVKVEANQHAKIFAHRVTSNFNIDLKDKSSFNLFYSLQLNDYKPKINSDMDVDREPTLESRNKYSNDKYLHSIIAEYQNGLWKIGADAIFYKLTSDQNMYSENQRSAELNSESTQEIKKFDLYVHNSSKIGAGTLSYGVDGFYSMTDNKHFTTWDRALEEDARFSTRQKEKSVDGFVGWSQKVGEKGMLSASLMLQYFHAQIEQKGDKQTLWEEWFLFPSLTYRHNLKPGQMLQLTFASNKSYPSYWDLNPSKNYINPYYMEEGNPQLKPYETYQLNLNYILHNKYIIGLFAELNPDYSTRLFYPYPDKLLASNRLINFDYSHRFGVMGVVPVKWNKSINTRLSANVYMKQDKGSLEDIVFDRNRISGSISLTNNFILNNPQTLSLQVSGAYQMPDIRGALDMEDWLYTSVSLMWQPKGGRWNFILKGEDLFNTYNMVEKSKHAPLDYSLKTIKDSRFASLSIRYSFGGYKEKRLKQVDTHRMGF